VGNTQLLPWNIFELVPSVVSVLAEDDYSLPLEHERAVLISEQIPHILNSFYRMVMDDCLDVLSRDGITEFHTDDNWAARFAKESELKGATDPEVLYIKQATSFFKTSRGLRSYDTLDEEVFNAPFSSVHGSVVRIARMIIAQLSLPSDIPMAHMLSLGDVFLCARCQKTGIMSWLLLLEHFQLELEIFTRENVTRRAMGLEIRISDSHSGNSPSPPARFVTASDTEEQNEGPNALTQSIAGTSNTWA